MTASENEDGGVVSITRMADNNRKVNVNNRREALLLKRGRAQKLKTKFNFDIY